MVNLFELLSKYPNITDIPEGDLKILGYQIEIKDGVASLLKESEYKRQQEKEPIKASFWELEMEVNLWKLNLVRNGIIFQKLYELVQKFGGENMYTSVFNEIQKELIKKYGYLKDTYLDTILENSSHSYIDEIYALYIDFLNNLSSDCLISEGYFLSNENELFNEIQENLKNIYTKYLQFQAKIQDKEEISKIIKVNLEKIIDKDDFNYYTANFNLENLEVDLKFLKGKEKISLKKFHYLHYAINWYLTEKWFIEVVKNISWVTNIDELREKLKKSVNLLPWFAESKNMSELIKQEKNIEKKKELSKEFSKKKEEFEKQRNIMNSIISFLSYENMIMAYTKKILDVAWKLFKVSQDKDIYEKIYLNWEFDAELDKDPWQVSWDCTQWNSLPFWKMKWLSNIKVLDNSKEHIWNIYLYEAEYEWKKIWHLDAIQIPGNYNWDIVIKDLFELLSTNAKKNWISKIVMSEINSHISNYDYIQNAVIKFHKENDGWWIEWDFIKEHFYTGHMQLQSKDDDAFFVIWEGHS